MLPDVQVGGHNYAPSQVLFVPIRKLTGDGIRSAGAAILRAREDKEIHNHGGKQRLQECVVYHPRGVQICVPQLQDRGQKKILQW
jgi:hypothetical protein